MNEELDKLEMKICYLEEQNAVLNEVVIEQGKDITRLEVQLIALEKKVKDLIDESSPDRPSRRPPHY